MSKKRPKTKRSGTEPERRKPRSWSKLSDEELLDLRLCDLGLSLEGTWVEDRVQQLYAELSMRGIKFRPRYWLSSEWFTPDGVPGIAIPFYLAHPRLRALEDRMMFEVEGGSKSTCMQLLRHEAGHAVEVAYRLARRPKWRKVFGNPSKPYPQYYRPKPFSRNYVLHLDWWYAQSHPYEDFAETFAVWLRPGSQWRRRYRGWRALKKLEYVDDLMSELAGKSPPLKSRATVEPVSRIKITLREHYREKQKRYGATYPDFYDRDLRRLFSDDPQHEQNSPAWTFLRKVGPEIRRMVATWTGEYAYTINLVLKEMIGRSRELNLHLSRPPHETKLELAVLLTIQTMNFVHSTDHRLPV